MREEKKKKKYIKSAQYRLKMVDRASLFLLNKNEKRLRRGVDKSCMAGFNHVGNS